jgi:hypothetical protein
MPRPFSKFQTETLRRFDCEPRSCGQAHVDFCDTVQAQSREAEQMRRAFGWRGERSCCDGKCLQRHGVCPAVQAERQPKRPSLWQRIQAFIDRHLIDPIVRD